MDYLWYQEMRDCMLLQEEMDELRTNWVDAQEDAIRRRLDFMGDGGQGPVLPIEEELDDIDTKFLELEEDAIRRRLDMRGDFQEEVPKMRDQIDAKEVRWLERREERRLTGGKIKMEPEEKKQRRCDRWYCRRREQRARLVASKRERP